jgi:uncharacterized alkaline shock family protein YloU|tara:strand:- start:7315 stop:7953 length:639 start_codon:yes stop_codon:yes gene_type:complete
MKVVLTESQFNNLLKEQFTDKVNKSLSNMSQFSNKVIKDAASQLKFDFRFLVSYGAGIGAILQSVFDYLQGNFTGLDDTQIAGLTVMAVGVVFFENKDLKEQIQKINDMGLGSELNKVISFTEKLKDKFSYLLKLLGLSIQRTSNIISYSFLIPLLTIVIDLVTKHGVDSSQYSMFIESLLTSGFIAISGVSLRDVLVRAGEMIENKGINQT